MQFWLHTLLFKNISAVDCDVDRTTTTNPRTKSVGVSRFIRFIFEKGFFYPATTIGWLDNSISGGPGIWGIVVLLRIKGAIVDWVALWNSLKKNNERATEAKPCSSSKDGPGCPKGVTPGWWTVKWYSVLNSGPEWVSFLWRILKFIFFKLSPVFSKAPSRDPGKSWESMWTETSLLKTPLWFLVN